LLVGASAVALVVAALLSDGFRASSYDLRDASVWVSSNSYAAVGRINMQVRQQDVKVPGGDGGVDVAQDGRWVFMVDVGRKELQRVDPATAEVDGGGVVLPEGATVEVAGEVLLVRAGAGAWFGDVANAGSVVVDPEEPQLGLGAAGAVALGRGGEVVSWSSDAGELRVMRGGEDLLRQELRLGKVEPGEVQVALVGETPAVLDRGAGRLHLPSGVEVDVGDRGGDPQLQLSGDDPERVLVATDAGLWAVGVGGGRVERLADAPGGGVPVRPVGVGGCSYAAWGGPNAAEAWRCGEDTVREPLREVPSDPGDLRFRVNREHVALNDVESGKTWVVVGDELREVSDWEIEKPRSDDQDDLTEEESERPVAPQLDEANEPPTAEPDQLGARPGRATLLSVLDNDTDPDGDVLTASVSLPDDGGFSVAPVMNGQALQITVPAGFDAQRVSFQYTVDDGHQGGGGCATCTASVEVTLYDSSRNEPPELKHAPYEAPRFRVSAGATGVYDELQAWWDPEGDPLVLDSARIEGNADDVVRSEPAGRLTYIDAGKGPGARDITVVVRDLPPASNEVGSLTDAGVRPVEVVEAGTPVPPDLVADLATTVAGAQLVIRPLDNDDPGTVTGLRITEVVTGASTRDAQVQLVGTDEVSFVASAAGSYVFGYEVNDPDGSVGLIRVDVRAAEEQPPSAAADVVVVPRGGQRTIDLLGNDVDPDGDVLVVTRVGPVSGSALQPGVKLQLLEHRRLRVSVDPMVTPGLVQDVVYDVSDGVSTVPGQVVVHVVEQSESQPPVPMADVAMVRAGDVVSVNVLANDVDPDGDALFLCGADLADVGTQSGTVFRSAQLVRFMAGSATGVVNARYSVDDSPGCESPLQGDVHITVNPEGNNAAPIARTLEARVTVGARVRVMVPLAGTDPDGDSVTLVGLAPAAPPQLGRVVTPVGADSLTYEAFDGVDAKGGTDEFSYVIEDSQGARATGRVRVGVAPRAAGNQPPVALGESVSLKPDRPTVVSVLANDYDPDGDPIALVEDGLVFDPALAEVSLSDSGDRLVITAHQSVGIGYKVADELGGTDTAVLNVAVSEDAPGMLPVARDDVVVRPDDGGSTASVKVLANDDDPDGDPAELVSELIGSPGWVRGAGDGEMEVDLAERARVFLYEAVDPDGLRSGAVVRVPGTTDNLPPRQSDGIELRVRQGDAPLAVAVADVVEDPEGAEVRLSNTMPDTAKAVHGQVTVEDQFRLSFQPDPGFAGTATLTFAVTDGPTVDSQDNVVVVSLPIEVEPPEGENRPPEWTAAPTLQVARGRSSEPFDLRDAVEDPDGDELSISVGESTDAQVQASLEGTRLVVSAAKEATAGTSVTIPVSADDGHDHQVDSEVTLTVVETDLPPPVCSSPEPVEATAGEEVSTEVLELCRVAEGELKLLGASSSQGETSTSGSTVRFRPAKEYRGNAEVSYLVEDDYGRTASGTWAVNVRDIPDEPSAPKVVADSSRTVELEWQPALDNGAPIDDYEVRWNGGSKSCGNTNRCTITGLTNGTDYTFTVRAHNEVGWGPESGPSDPAHPDQVPDAPTNVTLEFKETDNPPEGGTLHATWTASHNEGSPITAYEISIEQSGETTTVEGDATSITLDGLDNGTSYRISVRARNREGLSQPGLSNDDIPAKKPEAPAAPVLARVNDPLGKQLDITWQAPDDGGSEITGYQLDVYRNGTKETTRTLGGNTTSDRVTVNSTKDPYTVTVIAINKAGPSAPSAPSESVVAFKVPEAIATVTARDTVDGVNGLDGRAELELTPPDDGGNPITGYQVAINGAGASPYPSADITVQGLSNGQPYTFTVKACNAAGCGAPTTSNQVRPYGPPAAPSLSGNGGSTTLTWNWSPLTAAQANGRDIARYQVSLDGGGWQDDEGTTSWSRSFGYSDSHSLRVRAVNTAGQIGAVSNTVSLSTPPPPPPPVAGTLTVSDAYLYGTWTRDGTYSGTWGTSGSRPPGAVSWKSNGTRLDYICSLPGGDYEVYYRAGGKSIWNWWVRLSDGTYARTAALGINNDGQVGPRC
jgi:hypothetical protein